eukprot:920745-Alexandrium_andersonii.AAC.1
MSASLVGSEMCIRDSPSMGGWVVGALDNPRPRVRRGRLNLCAWPALNTVSYTHLTLPTICSV